jgi:hypothetical protein
MEAWQSFLFFFLLSVRLSCAQHPAPNTHDAKNDKNGCAAAMMRVHAHLSRCPMATTRLTMEMRAVGEAGVCGGCSGEAAWGARSAHVVTVTMDSMGVRQDGEWAVFPLGSGVPMPAVAGGP